MLVDENSLSTISDSLRDHLENLTIAGISEWNPVFSNGYGLGDNNTLVIDMRPAVIAQNSDICSEACKSDELIEIVADKIIDAGFNISFIDLSSRDNHPGFFIVVRLR